MTRFYEEVDIDNIINYAENPRHEVGVNEIDVLKKLVERVGSTYMYNLAKDIYENGILGSNLPVLVYDTEIEKYIVYEGNRRIASLKMLKNPSILDNIDKVFKQRIEKLKKSSPGVDINKIYCLVTDEKEAFFIMERVHSGEDQGRGLKKWSAKEKQAFINRQKNKPTVELIISELTEKYLHENVQSKMPFTTIQRFFNNRDVKKALAIDVNDKSTFTKEKIQIINNLIERSAIEGEKRQVPLTRLFNKARDVENFLLPLIINENIGDKRNPGNRKSTTEEDNPKIKTDTESDEPSSSLKFKLTNENLNYFTNQTLHLKEKLEIIDEEKEFKSELLEIECRDLNIVNGIIQPNNHPGEYFITFKYYMDKSKEQIYWQDDLKLILKLRKPSVSIEPSKTVLSKKFLEKYYNQLPIENSEKIESLILFLTSEAKNSRYSFFINIVSRMFLEYSFRLYARKVMKDDNKTIEDKSQSLKGLIDSYCNKIEHANPRTFVKHIVKGRKEATNKVDILQKSVHYFDVSISNDDIQVMFNNLSPYLEHIYDSIIKETLT